MAMPVCVRLSVWQPKAPRGCATIVRRKFDRYLRNNPSDVDLRRKAYVAVAAKLARVAHGLIKTESDYRPFFEEAIPGG
jgi:hypothetical protein